MTARMTILLDKLGPNADIWAGAALLLLLLVLCHTADRQSRHRHSQD